MFFLHRSCIPTLRTHQRSRTKTTGHTEINASDKDPESIPRREEILSAVGFAAGAFLQSASWRDVLDEVLERLGKAAQASRAYLFENTHRDDGAVVTSQIAEWVADGTAAFIDDPMLQDLPYVESGMGRWLEDLQHNRPVFGLVADFPESERELLESQDIRSIIVAPVYSQNRLFGFVGFDDCDNLREWSQSELDVLLTSTAALGAAIDREHLEHQLRFAQKMEAVGGLASGVAHDFNNVLQAITGMATLAKLDMDDNHSAHEQLDEILVASQRAERLTRQLLIFSHKRDSNPELLDLSESCDSVVTMVTPILGGSIRLSIEMMEPPPFILADVGLFSQLLLNLCLNARDAMPNGGDLSLTCERIDFDIASGNRNVPYARISVTDTGCGMTPEVQERVFEPFFTTKEIGEGTGLGLSVAYATVEQCGGFVDLDSELGTGTTFRIFIPIVEAQKALSHTPSKTVHGEETILLVDDEPIVLKGLRRILEAAGYTILAADDGKAAMKLFSEHRADIDLVITDSVMPEMDGGTLIDCIRKHDAEAKAILISGYAPHLPKSPEGRRNLIALQKPVRSEALHQAIRRLLD